MTHCHEKLSTCKFERRCAQLGRGACFKKGVQDPWALDLITRGLCIEQVFQHVFSLFTGIDTDGATRKTTKMMAIILGTFFGFFIPSAVHNTFIHYDPITKGCVSLFLNALFYTNAIVNPIIYGWMNKGFWSCLQEDPGLESFGEETRGDISVGPQCDCSIYYVMTVSENQLSCKLNAL